MFSALRIPNRERGQMLVIVALGLTVLIAMAGLIIDGGMALSNRRQVQNAADAASLAGTRVLGLDLKWRAVNAGNPISAAARRSRTSTRKSATRSTMRWSTTRTPPRASRRSTAMAARTTPSTWTSTVTSLGQRGGRRAEPCAGRARLPGPDASGTFLMGVIGIETIDVGADATAIAGPGEPPLGALMPFVAQNPLGPFVPGDEYQIRSEDEGECDQRARSARSSRMLAGETGIVLASYVEPQKQDRIDRGSAAVGAGRRSTEHDVHDVDHGYAVGGGRRKDSLHDRRQRTDFRQPDVLERR